MLGRLYERRTVWNIRLGHSDMTKNNHGMEANGFMRRGGTVEEAEAII